MFFGDVQISPHPIEAVINRITYKPGWNFSVRHPGPSLVIEAVTEDSDLVQINEEPIDVTSNGAVTKLKVDPLTELPLRIFEHSFAIPPAPPENQEWWLRFIFDCIVLVERHEAREFLRLDRERIFAPPHFGKPDRFGVTDPWANPPWPPAF